MPSGKAFGMWFSCGRWFFHMFSPEIALLYTSSLVCVITEWLWGLIFFRRCWEVSLEVPQGCCSKRIAKLNRQSKITDRLFYPYYLGFIFAQFAFVDMYQNVSSKCSVRSTRWSLRGVWPSPSMRKWPCRPAAHCQVGDSTYNAANQNLRLCLHCHRMELHDMDFQPLQVEEPLPEDFKQILDSLESLPRSSLWNSQMVSHWQRQW